MKPPTNRHPGRRTSAALCAITLAGRIGEIKSLEQLRGVCAHTGAWVLPGSVSVAGVQAAFDEEDNCTDQGVEDVLRGIGGALLEFIENYVCPTYALEAMVRGDG